MDTLVRVALKRLPEGGGFAAPAYMSEHAAGADLVRRASTKS